METLYVINSPCWTENAPSGLNNSIMFSEPFSENFTYFYYNLLKFGLVKNIKIFVEENRWRIDQNYIKKKIYTDYGSLELFKDQNKFEIINLDKEKNYVFCWSNISDCKYIKNKFIIVDNQFNGYTKKSDLNKNIHDLVLTESKNFKKYITEEIPVLVYKLISYDHEEFQKNNNVNYKKIYDWILVSSFDKRKRHIDFLNLLQSNNLSQLKGCIIARDPNNKNKKLFDFIKKKTPWKILKKVKELRKKMNFDLFLNVSQNDKIDLLSRSKVFVNPSSLDSGPRSQVEAAQLKIPILTMSHIGAADIVESGINGEIAKNLDELPMLLNKILNNINNYKYNRNDKNLEPEYFMPKLVFNIRQHYNKKYA
jgi:glycosyltransferase involved in cell wall biosynthesis